MSYNTGSRINQPLLHAICADKDTQTAVPHDNEQCTIIVPHPKLQVTCNKTPMTFELKVSLKSLIILQEIFPPGLFICRVITCFESLQYVLIFFMNTM